MRSKELPHSQVYNSKYSTVQTYNHSLEDLYETIKEKKLADKRRRKEIEKFHRKELEKDEGIIWRIVSKIWNDTIGKCGEEWVFLAFLGMIVAILSYTIDKGVAMCLAVRGMLYSELADQYFAKWVAWVCLPVVLILWDTGITQLIGSNKTIGSGIPQMKCCLRGVLMEQFLTFKVLIAKWWGITATLGSGMPLGKEGPLIHMSSIIVTKMSKAISSFRSIYINENKKIEMIGAAWAVGVATAFHSPIGGVLFSVEISTAYYAVRNYWRGFFAAVWAATTYRLLSVWIDGTDTIRVVFSTSFITDFPYDPLELISFAILGVICGFGGAFYMFIKRCFNNWMTNNKYIIRIKTFNSYIYPAFIVLLVSTITWPPGIGQFHASHLGAKPQVEQLFGNFTWSKDDHTIEEAAILKNWTTKWSGIFTNLVVFFWYNFICSIMAASMPVPNGSFAPSFRCGAALGRIAGELMHIWWPTGVRYKGTTAIMPGAYSMVGAAAFCGAVTQTLSTSVILFEMTSEISHVIPVLIANLIANGISRFFTPSLYDLAIRASNMPFLPDILPSTSSIYRVSVEDFMTTDVKYVYLNMSFAELKQILKDNKKIKMFPMVDNPRNMILLGSISRHDLIRLIDLQIGWQRRTDILPSVIVSKEENEQRIDTYMNDISEEDQAGCSNERENIFAKYDLTKRTLKKLSPRPKRRPDREQMKEDIKTKLSVIRVCDLPKEQQLAWEMNQMAQPVDFTKCNVDPAPFQLVERTSLIKVHSLFSLMSLNIAYVTSVAKLVGVVTLKDLSKAITDANQGLLPREIQEGIREPLLHK